MTARNHISRQNTILKKSTLGSSVRAGLEARLRSERRRPAAGSVIMIRTEHRASGSSQVLLSVPRRGSGLETQTIDICWFEPAPFFPESKVFGSPDGWTASGRPTVRREGHRRHRLSGRSASTAPNDRRATRSGTGHGCTARFVADARAGEGRAGGWGKPMLERSQTLRHGSMAVELETCWLGQSRPG